MRCMFKEMVKSEGILSLFKGNWANCLRIAPFQAIEFFMFEIYKKFLSPYSTISLLASGALAGISASAVVYPLDLVKTLLAYNTDRKQSMGIFK